MKTLLLMRHAKSSWKNEALPDHERPLAKRGLRDAHRMGELIERQELFPELVLASSALRAAETARIFCSICGCENNMQIVDALYLAEAETYIEVLKAVPDSVERVLVIGHNPGLEMLLQMLSGQIEALPTAMVAYLTLPIINWSEISTKTEGELVELWRPKDLPAEKKDKQESAKAAKTAKSAKTKSAAVPEDKKKKTVRPKAEKKKTGKPEAEKKKASPAEIAKKKSAPPEGEKKKTVKKDKKSN